jgi:hypothetical protein
MIVANMATCKDKDKEAHGAEARQKHEEMLQWLSSVDYSLQQAAFLRQRQEGTGQWFLESRQFQEWYSPCFLRTWLILVFCPTLISPPGYQGSQ